MDFVALDVETANPDQSSICAVGIVVFLNGKIIEERHTFVDPEDEFSQHHIRIHGVTPDRVTGAPKVAEMLEGIGKKYGGGTIVHHGHFDRTAFRRAFAKHGYEPWPCRWLDSAMVARRTWLEHAGAGGYGLKFLARHLGIPLVQHHDPLQDARAAGLLLLRAMADTGRDLDDWHARVVQPINRAISGGRQEGQVLAEVLQHEVIVFTGKLSVERHEAEALAKGAGFRVGDNVTRETSILVVGDQDVRRLAGKKVSGKQVKAEKYAEGGQSIRIVTESDFRDLIAQG